MESSKRKQKKVNRRQILQETCEQFEIPVVVAVSVLSGNLGRGNLENHPEREQWRSAFQRESEVRRTGDKTAQQKQKHQIADQLSETFGIGLNNAFSILAGTSAPTLVNRKAEQAQAQRQKQLAKQKRIEEQKRIEALNKRRKQWLTLATSALQELGVSTGMIEAILPYHSLVDPDTSPVDTAINLWLQRLHQSGFSSPGDLIDAWRRYKVWTVSDLAWAKEKQRREANAGMLPEQIAALCADERLEDTLHKLYHLNHWAKSRNLLLYVDRQGLYKVKARLLQEAYRAGKIKAVSYVGSDTPFEPFGSDILTDPAAEWFTEVLESSFGDSNWDSIWGKRYPLARQMYRDMFGKDAVLDDIPEYSIIEQRVEVFIQARLEQLAREAAETRQPIDVSDLESLFLSPDYIPSLYENGGSRWQYTPAWDDLDDDDLRPLDPEALSLVGFRYESPTVRYIFHLPLRVAEQFVPAGDIEALRASSERTREAGEFFGREISEDESLTHPIRELLAGFGVFGVAVNLVCPQGLVDKDAYIAKKQMQRSYFRCDFEDFDEEDEEDDEEYYFGDFHQEKKQGQSATFPVCPLCAVEVDAVDRFAHWQEFHPDVQAVTVSRAAWLLNLSKTGVEAKAGEADFRGEGNARYWQLETLRRIAIDQAGDSTQQTGETK